jgi:hypothetical protein
MQHVHCGDVEVACVVGKLVEFGLLVSKLHVDFIIIEFIILVWVGKAWARHLLLLLIGHIDTILLLLLIVKGLWLWSSVLVWVWLDCSTIWVSTHEILLLVWRLSSIVLLRFFRFVLIVD